MRIMYYIIDQSIFICSHRGAGADLTPTLLVGAFHFFLLVLYRLADTCIRCLLITAAAGITAIRTLLAIAVLAVAILETAILVGFARTVIATTVVAITVLANTIRVGFTTWVTCTRIRGGSPRIGSISVFSENLHDSLFPVPVKTLNLVH